MSLDGKIAATKGRSKWITGPLARLEGQKLRARHDAILVGSRTVLKDNPSLTVRLPGFKRSDGWPLRVVLDTQLKLSPGSKIFKGKAKTVVFASRGASPSREKMLLKQGILVFRVPLTQKMLSLGAVLKILHRFGVHSLMVEGGGQVHASFIKAKLADRVALFISPKIFGGPGPSWIGGRGIENPNLAPYLKEVQMVKIGEDFMLTGKF